MFPCHKVGVHFIVSSRSLVPLKYETKHVVNTMDEIKGYISETHGGHMLATDNQRDKIGVSSSRSCSIRRIRSNIQVNGKESSMSE